MILRVKLWHRTLGLIRNCFPIISPSCFSPHHPPETRRIYRPKSIQDCFRLPYRPNQTAHHINLCTLPGSCGHSNPLYRNIYPVTTLIARNHRVSSQSSYLPQWSSSLFESLDCCGEGDTICNRQNSHGRMKYRGSTRGAVASDREVAMSQARTKIMVLPCGVWYFEFLSRSCWD